MKKIIIFISILILVGVFFFGSDYYPSLLASLTYRNNIEEIGDGGFGNSMVLNSNKEPKISYIANENKLIFKEKTNNVWKEEIISEDALPGNKTDIAIDNNGNIYVLYIAEDNSLNLAKKDIDNWQIEKIYKNAALRCNLIFDKNNVLRVSFWSPGKGLAYGEKKDGKWNISILDYGKVGWWNDLAIDNNNNPHISYFDFENKDLLYLFFDGSKWHKEIVDKAGEIGSWNSIVLDKNDTPYISYFDQTDGNLRFAQKTKGGWLVDVVDKDGVVGERTNIILDEKQRPIISYVDLSGNSFKIAQKTESNWEIIIISSDNKATDQNIKGEGGLDNSIAIDSEGLFCLLWQNLFKEKLNYLQATF